MSDRHIPMSPWEVRALLEGRKTQTRRLIKDVPEPPAIDNVVHKPKHVAPYLDAYCGNAKTPENPRGMSDWWCWWTRDDRCGPQFKVGYAPGDRLWVREAHSLHDTHGQHRADGMRWGPWGGLPTQVSPDGTSIAYFREGFDRCDPSRWRPSIHMPRWASRLTLHVEAVRVQRLQDISEEDAIAEGIDAGETTQDRELNGRVFDYTFPWFSCPGFADPGTGVSAADMFSVLWNSIHGPDAWDSNPWVVAISFRVERANIDAARGQA